MAIKIKDLTSNGNGKDGFNADVDSDLEVRNINTSNNKGSGTVIKQENNEVENKKGFTSWLIDGFGKWIIAVLAGFTVIALGYYFKFK